MNKMTKFALGLVAVTTFAGCAEKGKDADAFFPDMRDSQVVKINEAQAASGARSDGTLSSAHFDGVKLNSLGLAKLKLMLKDDDACEPMVVYVDTPADGKLFADRSTSISNALKDMGLQDTQIKVAEGPNTGVPFPAFYGISRADRTENTGDDSSSGSGGSATQAPSAK